MRRNLVTLALIGALVISAPLLAEEPKKNDEKSDREKFQGLWAAINYVQDGEGEGEEIAPDESPVRWVFKGENITMLADVEDASAKGKYKLDIDKDPKTIDLVFPASSEDEKDQRILGIYSFDKDTLQICYRVDGEERPTEFEAKKDSKRVLIVFKRLKE